MICDMHNATPKNLVSIESAAATIDCSTRAVWLWLARGDIKRWKAGNRTLVDLDELVELRAPRPAD